MIEHLRDCDGNGWVYCWDCSGEGFVCVPDDDCTDREETCVQCDGVGGWPCPACDVSCGDDDLARFEDDGGRCGNA